METRIERFNEVTVVESRGPTTNHQAIRPAGTGKTWHVFWVPLSLLLGALGAAFGALQRFVEVDGISYLDVADAYLRGGWAEGANAYWSPLYPWLLAGARAVSSPAPAQELVVVQTVNFSVFVLALLAFVFFWREVGETGRPAAPRERAIPNWLWWTIGYLLFLWCTLRLIKVWSMKPDLLVFALVLTAGALLVRMHRRPGSWTLPATLGVVLATAYHAKAVMFPLGFVFVIAAFLLLGSNRAAAGRAGVAAALFLLVAAPFVVTLSLQKERFTFGDSGRLNYARYVNGVPDIHWQGHQPGNGTPAHPTRQISTAPPAFEFATPVGGTYPVWYDPSYWYEGVEVRLDPRQQLSALVRTGRDYVDLILVRQGAALAIVLLLLLGARNAPGPVHAGAGRVWLLMLPVGAAFGLYGLVYVEPRYVAPFLMLAWGTLLSALPVPQDAGPFRFIRTGTLIVAAVFALNLVLPDERMLRSHLRSPNTPTAGPWYDVGDIGSLAQLPAAMALADAGIRQGDGVAFIGYSYYAYWARLAGVRIVAEIPAPASVAFWTASPAERDEMTGTLLATGARAIVVAGDAGHPPPEGWQRLGSTGYYLLHAVEEPHAGAF